ncbi:MAG TPA: hypothetical protein VKU00_16960 [Chthonomonadaceae bacterium]|nr:hypothetical protein [Chthonomonadaceae bacterium]
MCACRNPAIGGGAKLDGKWLIVHEHNSVPSGNGNADGPGSEAKAAP